MSDERTALGEQIPEADLLEQQTPLDPLARADDTTMSPSAGTPGYANEADRLDQQAALPDDDEDDYRQDALAVT